MHARPFGCAAGAGTITFDGTSLSIEDAWKIAAGEADVAIPPPRGRQAPRGHPQARHSLHRQGAVRQGRPNLHGRHPRRRRPPQELQVLRRTLRRISDRISRRSQVRGAVSQCLLTRRLPGGSRRLLSFLSEGRFSCVLLHEEDLPLFLERPSRGVRIGTPLLFFHVPDPFQDAFLVCVFIRLGLHLKDCVHSFLQGFPCLI